jgi:hypothetical protein
MIHGTIRYKRNGISTAAILPSMCSKKNENVLEQVINKRVY